jgi:hypothetical protein
MELYTDIGSLESSTGLNPSVTGTCRSIFFCSGRMEVRQPVSMALRILADRWNVVGWQLVLNYMQTPPTHYYLECSGQAIYM